MIIKNPTASMYREALTKRARVNKTARAILGLLDNAEQFTNHIMRDNVFNRMLNMYTVVAEVGLEDEDKYVFLKFSIPKDISKTLEDAWAKIETKKPTLFNKIKYKLEQEQRVRERKREAKIKAQEEREREEKELKDRINTIFK